MFQVEKPRRLRKTETTQRRCHRCYGTGMCACQNCGGTGRVGVSRSALGGPSYNTCTSCYGNKRGRCRTCSGTGFTA